MHESLYKPAAQHAILHTSSYIFFSSLKTASPTYLNLFYSILTTFWGSMGAFQHDLDSEINEKDGGVHV